MSLKLSDLQKQFIKSTLQNADEENLIQNIEPSSSLTPQQQLKIYRNNVRLTLVEDLSAKYPVIQRLVGTKFFSAMAKKFIEAHPPKSGSLTRYGSTLPAFIAEFEHTQTLPYLADVATLEWHYYAAQYNKPAPALTAQQLQKIPQGQRFTQTLHLQPNSVLFESAYPVTKIYTQNSNPAHQPEQIDLASGPSYALITKPVEDVLLWDLKKGEFHFLLACQRGMPLVEAKDIAFIIDQDFSFEETLIHHLSGKTFCAFTTLEQKS